MAKKVEEEVVLTKADFEQAVKELGECLGEEITIEGDKDECVEEFLNLVGGIDDAQAKNLPDIVFTVNNALIDKGADVLVWEEVAEEVQEETQVEVTQEEETPEPIPKKKDGRGRPKGSTKNKEVKKEEKVMKEKPKVEKVVEKKVVAPVKKEVVVPAKKLVKKEVALAKDKLAKVEKAPAKTKAELGRYGHRKGSAADFMDEMIWKGCTLDEAVATIVKGLDKTKERAKGMFLAHVYYLPNKKNIPIDKPKAESGKYKAKKANTDI